MNQIKKNRYLCLKHWQIAAVLILLGVIARLYTQDFSIIYPSWQVGECYMGKVIRVADGDTVTLLDAMNQSIRVRLAFIDAPELSQPYGKASQRSLGEMVKDQDVWVKVWDKDQYGRMVGQIWWEKDDIGLMQIVKGYAWHYPVYAKKQQNKMEFARYQKAQKTAKKEQLGLWQEKQPISPWRFRQQKRIN